MTNISASVNNIVIPISDMLAFEKKIRAFSKLRKGWDYGEGIVPNKETREKAIAIAKQGHQNLFTIDSTPGSNGEIEVVLYRKPPQKHLSIRVFCTKGKVELEAAEYKKTDNGWKLVKRDSLNEQEVDHYIFQYSLSYQNKWQSTSAPYLRIRTVATSKASVPPHSKMSGTVFPYFAKRA